MGVKVTTMQWARRVEGGGMDVERRDIVGRGEKDCSLVDDENRPMCKEKQHVSVDHQLGVQLEETKARPRLHVAWMRFSIALTD
jgi:hypothetical protein